MHFVSVVTFKPVRRTFDYSVPANLVPVLGARVRAPFGRSTIIGLIVAINSSSAVDSSKIKSIIEILDEQAIMMPQMLELLQWASNYYFIPLGMLYKLGLPKKIREGELLSLIVPPPAINSTVTQPSYELNGQQQQAIAAIAQHLGSFKVHVLDGVTGSGKTEVYLQLIANCLARGQQVLVLIPEINLGPQTIARFNARFPAHNIGLLHSKVSEKKRLELWQQAFNGNLDIIIGTRLAAFTQIAKLGLIIIDEEHDLSFKQQDSCRYSAKDLLIKRAQLANCVIVLGSATLSLETWHNVQQHKYAHSLLTARTTSALTQINIIDIRHNKLFAGLSEALLYEIRQTLARGQQVFIFLNRRGFARILFCNQCNWHLTCTKCSSNMIMHYKTQHMICHHCERKTTIPISCPQCANNDLNPMGVGTERLELALKEKFYQQEILRVDRDTIKTPKQLELALDKIVHNKVQLIVGTQMLSKGHHFPHLSLVAIIDIDSALYSADFHAIERLGQLITQVAGRAGREAASGQVFLQTCDPQNPIFSTLLQQPFAQFLALCLRDRELYQLPPFNYQILIISSSKKITTSEDFLLSLKDYIQASRYREHYCALAQCLVSWRKRIMFTVYT
jgi:primosomal protein N' (replication factor Y)